MFMIALRNDDGVTVYWTGGVIFSVQKEDAALFVREVDAENTIPLLNVESRLHKGLHVVKQTGSDKDPSGAVIIQMRPQRT
jgi:hypothetical protein